MKQKNGTGAKRWLAAALCLCMLVSSAGRFAYAAEKPDGETEVGVSEICEHHPEHTRDCGYVEAVEGKPCRHEHTKDCFGAVPAESETVESVCGHVHDESCGYAAPAEGTPCTHEHTDECFKWVTECVHEHTDDCYAESNGAGNSAAPSDTEEGKLVCGHECSEESGCITKKTVCQHEHDSECGYSEGSEGTPCSHVHDESCGYLAAEEPVQDSGENELVLICPHANGEHDDTCGYAEAVEGHPCTFVCEICPTKDRGKIQLLSVLPDEIAMQTVPVGTALEELNLPSELSFTDEEGKTVIISGVTWKSGPEYDGNTEGKYVFTPILPETYDMAEGVSLPQITVTVKAQNETEYSVSSAEEFESALDTIGGQEQTDFVIVLKNDISLSNEFAGLAGKRITLRSESGGNYKINLSAGLQGDITLENVNVSFGSRNPVFANGHRFETTEAYKGTIHTLYGGSNKTDLTGDTNLILGGGTITVLHGGSLDGAVNGNVSITIDGSDVRIDNLYGGGHAKDSASGTVSGNVTINMRQGSNGFFIGGGHNEYAATDNENDREPAKVAGTVTVTLGYEGAPEKTVWPGTAMFTYAGSYHSTVGNTILNVTDGFTSESDAGDRDLFGCGYNDTVLGTVEINIYGAPDIGSSFIYGGGNTEQHGDWPVRILNQENKEYALHVTYNVPNEADLGHGINAGADNSLPMTIEGNILVELKNGNMDFLVLDNENAGNLTVHGNSEIVIHEGRVAQVQGNRAEYDSEETNYTTTVKLTDKSETGYFYRFDEVELQEGAEVLVDATKFSQFGNAQKPFFSVDSLSVQKNATLTTQNNGQARILNSVTLKGTWEQCYQSGKPLPDDDNRANADLRIGGSVTIDGGTLISRGTTHIYNNLTATGGTLVFMNPAIAGMSAEDAGRVFSVSGTKIYLPVIGTGDAFYPAQDALIRLAIGEKATGSAEVYLFEGDDYTKTATITDGHVGQNYINAQREKSDALFTLMTQGGYYFKRVNDSKTVDTTAYDMWQIAKQEEQLWYYEVYYETFDEETGASKWIRQTHEQGGWAYPQEPVSISHEKFDGTELSWEDITGTQKEKLGTHYVYDEDYGPHRLTASAGEATKDNPLKIYYRAALHDVVYEYTGEIPAGAGDLLPETEKKPYYSSVEVADIPELAGYEFSGWTIQSPAYTTIENGKFIMPNETVTLVGSWTKKDNPGQPEPEEKAGILTVSKTVSGDRADTARAFHFTVTLNDTSISGVYGDMEFKDGIASFTLKHGENKSASGLPANVSYTVAEQEANQDGYTTTVTGASGRIEADETTMAAFHNYRSGDESGGNDDNSNNNNDNNDNDMIVEKVRNQNNGGQTSSDIPDTQDVSSVSGNLPEPDDNIPQSGDTASPVLWLTLLAISGAGLAAALISGKKKRHCGRRMK